MDKRIGNYSFFLAVSLVVFISLEAQQGLQLRVVGKNHDKAVTKLTLGVPYTLEIQAEGNQDLYAITVPGLENFHCEFCGASHMSLMSQVTTVHNYILRADKLGNFILGPVKIITPQGTVIVSNTLSLNVVEQEQSDVIVEMLVDKTHLVAGQKIGGKVRFCRSIELQLLNLQLPSIDAKQGQCSQIGQPVQSKITREGKEYDCYEFPIELTFNQPGSYALPKIGACCRVPVKKQRSAWGFNVAVQSYQDQWFYATEAIILHVDPLPSYPYPVDGIGLFDSVTMSIDHSEARIGEGIVLRLTIEGKEGVHEAKQPKLTIPEGLKYYESKSLVEPSQRGGHKKICEYIVQGLQGGKWEIPAQVFTFFDTKSKSYKTLKSQPLVVTIKGNAQLPVNTGTVHTAKNDSDSSFIDNDIITITSDGPWFFSSERSLSALWFLLTILLPCFIACYLLIKKYIVALTPDYWINKRKKYAFKLTRKKLNKIKRNNNSIELYDVFTQLFADRCQISLSEMNADRIEQLLKNAGFVAETIDQWNRFFHQLAEYAFFKQPFNQTVSHDLLNRAQIWINQLEEKL